MNNYYTILPANVRYDSKLPPNAKILYSELLALSGDKGFCWASNRYLAKLFNVDKATVSRWISMLHKRHYIFFKPIDKNINTDDDFITDYRQIYLPPIDKIINPNNKNNNKKSNNTRARSKRTPDIEAKYDLEAFEEYLENKPTTLSNGNEISIY